MCTSNFSSGSDQWIQTLQFNADLWQFEASNYRYYYHLLLLHQEHENVGEVGVGMDGRKGLYKQKGSDARNWRLLEHSMEKKRRLLIRNAPSANGA